MPRSETELPDFDTEIDRTEVGALKFDGDMMASIFGERDLWPSWAADMDFRVAQPIQQTLARRLEHGVYGYESSNPALPEAVAAWFGKRHGAGFVRINVSCALMSPAHAEFCSKHCKGWSARSLDRPAIRHGDVVDLGDKAFEVLHVPRLSRFRPAPARFRWDVSFSQNLHYNFVRIRLTFLN